MIQRIQTVYLIIADLLISALFFVPLAQLTDKEGVLYHLNVTGIVREGTSTGAIQNNWPLLILVSMILILICVIIFQFKNRPKQIMLSNLILFFLVGTTGLICLNAWNWTSGLGGTFSLNIYAALPLLSAVSVYLAIRGIKKDENLVKSIDRIR